MTILLEERRQELRRILRMHCRLIVAYSGGIDSAYLAWEAAQVLQDNMLAIIAVSPSLPESELADAIAFAQHHSIPIRVIHTHEMARPEYVRNDANRCFHCKDELFNVLTTISVEMGNATIAYGRNYDDGNDYRPGQRAADLHRAVAPLAEAQLGKTDIRALARAAGLTVWDKPASACLASRLEYGRQVTAESLRQIERSEQHLKGLGFRQVRVRHHGNLARVEIERSELPKVLSLEMLEQIGAGVRATGFTYVTLDTEGYRSDSMNALLPAESLFNSPAGVR
jgi:pyridinium-3,5-biscarboxylic acid mononucleotide sulfurtransferase